MSAPLDPVPFDGWLRGALAALDEDHPAEVPCGPCNACCRTRHYIHVRPSERRALRRLPRRYLLPAPGLPPGHLVLGHDDAGRCPVLVDGRCTVYSDRPIVCRTYDCRIYAAAGVTPDRKAIAAQVERWRFACPTEDDERLLGAVRAAARFIAAHPSCLAHRLAARDPLRLATLAVACHAAFLHDGTEPERAEREREAGIALAHERLFGDL